MEVIFLGDITGPMQICVFSPMVNLWKYFLITPHIYIGYQHHYKAIIEAAIFSTPEGCNDNSPIAPNEYERTKRRSAIK